VCYYLALPDQFTDTVIPQYATAAVDTVLLYDLRTYEQRSVQSCYNEYTAVTDVFKIIN
jgi:hypothetical protein